MTSQNATLTMHTSCKIRHFPFKIKANNFLIPCQNAMKALKN